MKTQQTERNRLASRVSPAQYLQAEERETVILIEGQDVTVESSQKGLMQRLIRHPMFEINQISVATADGGLRWGEPPFWDDTGPIIRVRGPLPITHLSIPVVGRDDTMVSKIVSDGVYDADCQKLASDE